ncbi:LysR family transcriptional regulator [Rahnella sp. FC061912-K]|uniref:LysR family transcriptional regulator n=1 Tax=Rahnella rivi TaxID=2816249 RepID=UPI0006FC29EE|nr:LysR family transcriptional regulator [Rahnella rivi]KQN67827.1 LysR family transcriptional regulator [Serratia sp. Leaf51]MBU9830911.1 LysR family transcriptional regulator [Rahnella rivi]
MTRPFTDSVFDLGQINLRLMHYFRVVAEELSFSKAAVRLNMSQPPLSLHIKELEVMLGTPLFLRTTRSVALTPAGAALMREAGLMLDGINRSLHQVRKIGRGEVGHIQFGTVGTAAWGPLMPALNRFGESAPEITWSITELTPLQQIDALQLQRIDIGIWREAKLTLPQGLSSRLMGRENVALAIAENHPLAAKNSVVLGELAHEDFILMPMNTSSLGGYLYSMCRQHGFLPQVRHQVNEPQTALALVANGYGITLLPESYARIHWPGVRFCALSERLPVDLYALYQADSLIPAAARFLDSLGEDV